MHFQFNTERTLCALLLPLICFAVAGSKDAAVKPQHPTLNHTSGQNHTKPSVAEDQFNATGGLPNWMESIRSGALQRTGYVALGFMSVIMILFVIRAIRIRQKRSKSRKYGIITSAASDMEMEPLDRDDDDEEETTLFDAQQKYSLK